MICSSSCHRSTWAFDCTFWCSISPFCKFSWWHSLKRCKRKTTLESWICLKPLIIFTFHVLQNLACLGYFLLLFLYLSLKFLFQSSQLFALLGKIIGHVLLFLDISSIPLIRILHALHGSIEFCSLGLNFFLFDFLVHLLLSQKLILLCFFDIICNFPLLLFDLLRLQLFLISRFFVGLGQYGLLLHPFLFEHHSFCIFIL